MGSIGVGTILSQGGFLWVERVLERRKNEPKCVMRVAKTMTDVGRVLELWENEIKICLSNGVAGKLKKPCCIF